MCADWADVLLTCVQVNTEIVQIQRVQTAAGQAQLKALIQAHVDATQSSKGAAILGDWNNQLPKFWQLVPPSEVRLLAYLHYCSEAALRLCYPLSLMVIQGGFVAV